MNMPKTVDDLIFANLNPLRQHLYRLLAFHPEKLQRWAGAPYEVEFLSDYEARVLLEEVNKFLGIEEL